jgi:hypothetical protein
MGITSELGNTKKENEKVQCVCVCVCVCALKKQRQSIISVITSDHLLSI